MSLSSRYNAHVKERIYYFFLACSAYCHSRSNDTQYDLIVVGGGIIGLATAREAAIRHPKMRIALVEKERELGMFWKLVTYK